MKMLLLLYWSHRLSSCWSKSNVESKKVSIFWAHGPILSWHIFLVLVTNYKPCPLYIYRIVQEEWPNRAHIYLKFALPYFASIEWSTSWILELGDRMVNPRGGLSKVLPGHNLLGVHSPWIIHVLFSFFLNHTPRFDWCVVRWRSRTCTIKARVYKRLDYVLKFYWLLHTWK